MNDREWLLAIDTSTDWCGIALTNGRDWAELNWSSGRHQTIQVLPEIERLANRMATSIGQVGAIAVAIGPGSFSGLRVGLSLAKGFVLAEQIPLIGVSTLDVTTHGWDAGGTLVTGVIRAGRKRYVWADHASLSDIKSGEQRELVDSVGSGSRVVGEIDEDVAASLTATGCAVPPEPARRRRAGSLAALAWPRWLAGETDDPGALEPIYIHPA